MVWKVIFSCIRIFSWLILALFFASCVREYELDPEGAENQIVIEGYVSDQPGDHEIKLSFSGSFRNPTIRRISDASIRVIEDQLEIYEFVNTSAGVYTAVDNAFIAVPGSTYQLEVDLPDGSSFRSEEVSFVSAPQIASLGFEDVTIRSELNTSEQLGIRITLSNEPNGNEENFFRYTSETTWLAISPLASGTSLRLVMKRDEAQNPIYVERIDTLVFNELNDVCWFNDIENRLKLASSEGFVENVIKGAPVLELPYSSRMVNRFSTLVNQYALSPKGYAYYNLNSSFSEGDGLLFNQQPGFVEGNVFASAGDKEVIGIFQASGRTSKRIGIDYTDLSALAQGEVDKFKLNCVTFEIILSPIDSCEREFIEIPDNQLTLEERLLKDSLTYVDLEELLVFDSLVNEERHLVLDYEVDELECDSVIAEAQILSTTVPCADCVAIGGSKERPEWWLTED